MASFQVLVQHHTRPKMLTSLLHARVVPIGRIGTTTSRVGGGGNRIGPVCQSVSLSVSLSVRVCETYVMHYKSINS